MSRRQDPAIDEAPTPVAITQPGRGAAPGDGRTTDVVLVAAGQSQRMAGVDKLFAPIAGRPLIRWTLDALASSPDVRRILIVTAPSKVEEISRQPWLPDVVVGVVAGGARRQESVAAGLEALDGPAGDVVLIHDAARPLVSSALIGSVARAAAEHGAAIPVLPVAETLKRLDGQVVAGTVERESLAAAQTPQGFRRELLVAAYERHSPWGPRTWTDEAALLEACRIPVHAIPGEPMNLKVTVPDDLVRAEAALAAVRTGPGAPASGVTAGSWIAEEGGVAIGGRAVRGSRVAIGSDSHPFGPGSPLVLGGLVFDRAPRLHGHSDGDVALHAVADALLGAAGLGDLGLRFPAGPETPHGISSAELLADVVRAIATEGWRPAFVDVTVTGARPRIGDRLREMADRIAALLAVAPERVNVKASTGNLGGREGAGRAIAAEAVAVLEPLA